MDIHSLIKSLERAENDNRKFALLLILSELIKTNKLNELKLKTNESKQLNERLFNSIGSHFLARLISTRQVAENCSPLMFKSVAFSILTQFLDYPKLICDPILLSKIDIICDTLLVKQQSDQEAANDEIANNLVLDAFKYLYALSTQCADYLVSNGGLLELLMEKLILNENYDKDNRFKHETKQLDESDLDFLACKLFILLCTETNKNNKNQIEISAKISKCLKSLLNAIKQNQNRFKFCLINNLNCYFLEDLTTREYFATDFASDLLFNVLNDLFRSKLSRAFKVVAFKLLDQFVKLFQFECIYLKNRSFFYFIIHLLCIEISYSLEEATQATTSNQEIDSNLTDRISIYYSLLEEIIIILSTASPFDDNEDQLDDTDEEEEEEKEPKDKEPELENAIKVIVEALEAILMFVKDALDEMSNLKPNELILQVASIRLLICWLSHETLLEEKLIELMPKLIKFADFSKTEQVNLFQFLKPGLERYLIDLKERQEFLSQSKQMQTDLVRFQFEQSEINEKINTISNMLQTCNINL